MQTTSHLGTVCFAANNLGVSNRLVGFKMEPKKKKQKQKQKNEIHFFKEPNQTDLRVKRHDPTESY